MNPAPQINTIDRVLQLINSHPNGITIRTLCDRLDRPVSMVQICLKQLAAKKKVRSQLSANKMHLIYYPIF